MSRLVINEAFVDCLWALWCTLTLCEPLHLSSYPTLFHNGALLRTLELAKVIWCSYLSFWSTMGHSMATNDLIIRLANISYFDQQSVFLALSRFPSIHQPILQKATSNLVNTLNYNKPYLDQRVLLKDYTRLDGVGTWRQIEIRPVRW